MTRALGFTLLGLLTVGLMSGGVLAQPTISGSLSGTLGPGTYIVVGDCQVNAGASLTIQPGTTFLHAGHHTWYIYGTLNAQGTLASMINFVRQFETEACKWGGIRFRTGSSPNSVLQYCKIDYGLASVSPNYSGGGIYIENVAINVLHCQITNCQAYYYGGAIFTSSSNSNIAHCIINNNTASSGGAIFAQNSALIIESCRINTGTAGNGGGVYLYSSNNAQIRNSVIIKCVSSST